METLNSLFSWVNENWIIIALVVSETAALLPGTMKGILQSIVKIGQHIFQKSSGKP